MSYQKDSNVGVLPPKATKLEKAILGALMLESDAYYKICDILTSDCFYIEAHKLIFKAIKTLIDNRISVDILTVVDELKRLNLLNKAGGVSFVSELTNDVVTAFNIITHAQIVKQMYLKREAIRMCSSIVKNAYDASIDVADLITEMQNNSIAISKDAYAADGINFSDDCINDTVKELEKRKANYEKGVSPGLSTGNKELDLVTGKLQKGELVVIGARPSVGKSLLAVHQMMTSLKEDEHVVLFSLEMGKVEITSRMISSYGVNGLHLRDGCLSIEDEILIDKFKRENKGKQFEIIDKGGISVQYITSTCKNIHRKKPISLIIIDYLQLLNAPGQGKRTEQLTYCSGQLKALAMELGVTVIALAQLNRESAKETGEESKKPRIDQLRETGAIEQDADKVILLHKPNFYNSEGIVDSNGDKITNKDALLIVAKNRNGDTGEVKITWGNFIAKMYPYHKSPEYTGVDDIKESLKPIEGVIDYSAGFEDLDNVPF